MKAAEGGGLAVCSPSRGQKSGCLRRVSRRQRRRREREGFGREANKVSPGLVSPRGEIKRTERSGVRQGSGVIARSRGREDESGSRGREGGGMGVALDHVFSDVFLRVHDERGERGERR